MKYLILFLLTIACAPNHKEKKDYSLPAELADCKVFWISDGWKDLYVLRCPNSSTTTSWSESCGKNCYTQKNVQVIENDIK